MIHRSILRKHISVFLAAVMVMSVLLCVPADADAKKAAEPKIKSIKITNITGSYVLPVGKSVTLKLKTSPSVSVSKLKFTTSSKKIATVSAKGKIKGKKKGTVTITVSSKKQPKVKAKVKFKIGKRVSKLSFSALPPDNTLLKGASFQLKLKVSPSAAANKKVTWSTSNKKVLTVSSAGLIKAKAAGTATITAKAKDGSGVKVSKKITVRNPVSSMNLSSSLSRRELRIGETFSLAAEIKPSSALKDITWSSSDPSVASVTADGHVTALKKGTAVITAGSKDGSGKSAAYSLRVISLDPSGFTKIAHRGYSEKAPENSATAFALAAAAGFDGMECDVRKTKDNEFVLSHDASLLRVFGVGRLISGAKYAEIKDLKATGGNGSKTFNTERLITIREYMNIVSKYKKKAVIELKEDWTQKNTDKFYDIVASYGMNDRVEFISFSGAQLERIQKSAGTYAKRHAPKEETAAPETTAEKVPETSTENVPETSTENSLESSSEDTGSTDGEDESGTGESSEGSGEGNSENPGGGSSEGGEQGSSEESGEGNSENPGGGSSEGGEQGSSEGSGEGNSENPGGGSSEGGEQGSSEGSGEGDTENPGGTTPPEESLEGGTDPGESQEGTQDSGTEDTAAAVKDEQKPDKSDAEEEPPANGPRCPEITVLTSDPMEKSSSTGGRTPVEYAAAKGWNIGINKTKASASVVSLAKSLGMKVEVYVVDDYFTANYFAEDLGVDSITSNTAYFAE